MSDCVYEARVHGPPYMGEVSGTWCTTHRCWADECDTRRICRNCKYFELPPKGQWPNSAIGACRNLDNVVLGPSGWNSGDGAIPTSDLNVCSNYVLKK